jgi:dTDP-4-amino-4,6-dideoxygalactose transaminase
MCSHREKPYVDQKRHHDLRQSELAQERAVLLPIYAQMKDTDQIHVANELKSALRAGSRPRASNLRTAGEVLR